VFSNSLVIVMGAIFLASWFAQSVSGWTVYNAEAQDHMEPAISWIGYLGSADFWEATSAPRTPRRPPRVERSGWARRSAAVEG